MKRALSIIIALTNLIIMQVEVEDKAGKEFWNMVWEDQEVPTRVDPNEPSWEAVFVSQIDDYFRTLFSKETTKGKSFLELGCGGSIWLPYFAKEFGFEVSGIDYSETGCEKERRILEKAQVSGDIHYADFFDSESALHSKFDFVYSSGVAEHFVPTSRCISAFKNFLKPGGTMITLIPNMAGVIGSLQKILNKEVYDIHVVLDREDLEKAHNEVGLNVVNCKYLQSTGFGVLDTTGLDESLTSTKIKNASVKNLSRISLLLTALENKTFRLPKSKLLSPFIGCIATKLEKH